MNPPIYAYLRQLEGMPYKYVVPTHSAPFNEAPAPILEALRRMLWAGQHAVPEGAFQAFNELLAVGYFEGMKMGVSSAIGYLGSSSKTLMAVKFHDDGEKTLGATVASLVLGCWALMKWRMKWKYYTGFMDNTCNKYDPSIPVLPGCNDPTERLRLKQLASTMSPEDLNKEARRILRGKKRNGAHSPVVLTMLLCHGDMIIMHGSDMQKYYEHSVDSIDGLRFALTCRHVLPAEYPDQLWKGRLPEASQEAYDGDYSSWKDKQQKLS